MGFVDLINDSIEKNQVWRSNSNQFTKIVILETIETLKC